VETKLAKKAEQNSIISRIKSIRSQRAKAAWVIRKLKARLSPIQQLKLK
jgi:hypothetical protein